MYPGSLATRNERDTTSTRANILREVLTNSTKANPFDSDEIAPVMDLCLSCKGCKAECPSNVDVARLKAEWLQQRYDVLDLCSGRGLIGGFSKAMSPCWLTPGLFRLCANRPVFFQLFKRFTGFLTTGRSISPIQQTISRWHRLHANKNGSFANGHILVFCDEFTNFNDADVSMGTVLVLRSFFLAGDRA